MQIDIYKAIFELEHLIENAKLSESQRNKYKTNIQAMRQVATEWEKLKDNGRTNTD